ncbi:MAG: hypothetical protein ABR567_10760 [Myxococcales bacterium]
MKLRLLALLFAAACSHGDTALRDEQARSRHYRDAYETQAQEIAHLKARVAELEKRDCR